MLVEPVDQPWGERVAYVRDPEGNAVMRVTGSAEAEAARTNDSGT